jgi:hypothetical protein
MKEKLAGLPSVLKELLLGIAGFGALLELTLVWFFSDKLLYTSGLALGVLTAALSVGHMYRTLDSALDMMADDAERHVRRGTSMRFLLMVIVFLAVYFLKIGNIVAFFLGDADSEDERIPAAIHASNPDKE